MRIDALAGPTARFVQDGRGGELPLPGLPAAANMAPQDLSPIELKVKPAPRGAKLMVRERAKSIAKRLIRSPARTRRYLPQGVSVDEFLTKLTEVGANYAVLRWFESLPAVDAGEDIDLLVSDEDLSILETMLSPYPLFPATQPVDLYSISGMRGTDYRGVPYFPKKLSLRILENAILIHGKYRVPAPRDHFQSLAFHAVYHKGEASGLPLSRTEGATVTNADHDYLATLKRVRRQAGERADLTLQGLDRYLARKGLRPAGDLLERYQTRNAWLRGKLRGERRDIGAAAGLIAFVVRDRALPYADEAAAMIDRHGFEVLHVISLTEDEKARVGARVRGGNWGRGPFPESGGEPAAIILACDFRYRPVTAEDGQVVNDNATLTKYAIRDLIHSRVPRSERFNPMHSTDNGWQSLECLEALDRPGLIAEVTKEVAAIERKLQLPWPVVRELSVSGRRARVLLVDHPVHGEVVAKVFRPGASRFFDRELQARQELSGLPCVPELIDHGDNWLLTPYYSNTGAHVLRPLPNCGQVQLTFDAMAALTPFVRALRERNYFLLDLATHNLITDPDAGLLMLDFEFLQRYPVPTPPLEDDYTILGLALHPGCDAPVYSTPARWVRNSVFHRAVCGLSPEKFFTRANTSLRMKMAFCQAFWWSVFSVHRSGQAVLRRKYVQGLLRVAHRAARAKPQLRLPALQLPQPRLHPQLP
ncbi:MAG: serine/threonine protein kinase [Sphingomonas sp.]|nr:serine/threonine protein kinase [Sphingomonas sp.]